jgi:hypothetical protein
MYESLLFLGALAEMRKAYISSIGVCLYATSLLLYICTVHTAVISNV